MRIHCFCLMALLLLAGCSKDEPLPAGKADEEAPAKSAAASSVVVARVFDREIVSTEIGWTPEMDLSTENIRSCGGEHPPAKLGELVWKQSSRHFIEENGLRATDGEVQEMRDYMDRFEKEDRANRAKQLARIEARLATGQLSDEEREKQESYRKTLLRLAEIEREDDARSAEFGPDVLREIYAPWIETWKMGKVLHEKYGGAVAVTKFGPDPIGARAALLKDYETQGKLAILDEALRKAFWAEWERPPRYPADPDNVDFSPFWKKK